MLALSAIDVSLHYYMLNFHRKKNERGIWPGNCTYVRACVQNSKNGVLHNGQQP